MKQLPTEKYNVAWFKLAEFVSRGEKERALAIYKLLAHTLKDQAFVHQLEGDLLLSFNDETAFERYAEAAKVYAQQLRISQATAVYEHMITLEPQSEKQLQLLVDVYLKIADDIRAIESTQHLMRWMMGKKEFDKVSFMLQQIDAAVASMHHDLATIHQELVTQWLKNEEVPQESVFTHVKKTIDYYLSAKQQKSLQTFLMTLKMMHDLLYQKACGYMQEGDVKI